MLRKPPVWLNLGLGHPAGPPNEIREISELEPLDLIGPASLQPMCFEPLELNLALELGA